MKKMLVIIALALALLLAGCLQQQTGQNGTITSSAAQVCMKTPGMSWCDKEAKCIDPAFENCT